MTTAPTPHARTGSFTRARHVFRRWRQGRPFWGGLLIILSGITIFLSSRLDLGMEVHVGPQGFLATIIPAALALAGVLLWISPAQRLFYGIIAALIAVGSLVWVNLGGWVVGMLLGMVGGSLAAAWSPIEPAEPEPPVHDEHHPAEPDERPSGGAAAAEYERPPMAPLPRRDVRAVAHVLAALFLGGALGVAVINQSDPALAAPACLPSAGQPTPDRPPGDDSGTATAPAPGNPAPPVPPTSPPPTPSTPPTPPSTGGSPADRQGPVERVVDLVRNILGGAAPSSSAGAEPSSSAQPAASESASPAPAPSASAPPTPTPSAGTPTQSGAVPRPPVRTPQVSACPPAPAKPKVIAAAPGQPPVAQLGGTMLAANLTMSGLSFDGVVDLPTSTGTIRVLQFSMSRSVATPFELRVPGGPRLLSLRSSQLTVEGNVKFYTNRFSGNLLCLIPVTFTPDSPPRLILSELQFCNADITLNFVQSDRLSAPNLDITFRTG